jgi:hypothetical protein
MARVEAIYMGGACAAPTRLLRRGTSSQ